MRSHASISVELRVQHWVQLVFHFRSEKRKRRQERYRACLVTQRKRVEKVSLSHLSLGSRMVAYRCISCRIRSLWAPVRPKSRFSAFFLASTASDADVDGPRSVVLRSSSSSFSFICCINGKETRERERGGRRNEVRKSLSLSPCKSGHEFSKLVTCAHGHTLTHNRKEQNTLDCLS